MGLMNDEPTWHADTIEHLAALLRTNSDVVALAIYGSALRPKDLDAWSDLDALIVVRDEAMPRFFPSTDWLSPLGQLYAKEQFTGDRTQTTRLCFEDLRKLDLVFTTTSNLQQIGAWLRVPSADGLRVCFARAPEVTQLLGHPFDEAGYTPPTDEQVGALVDAFWFRSMVAVTKVARDDLVIGLHLALSLLQDGCVLAMMLRDRAEGTNVHRTGGVANEVVATFADVAQPPTPEGILNLIEASGRIFDRLAHDWSSTYQPKIGPLRAAIMRARAERGL